MASFICIKQGGVGYFGDPSACNKLYYLDVLVASTGRTFALKIRVPASCSSLCQSDAEFKKTDLIPQTAFSLSPNN